MADKPLLILARHGSTPYNASELGDDQQRLRGWLDLPLTKQGVEEAHELAEKISHFPIEEVWSSDLKRALDTAHVLGEKLGMPIEVTRDLRPWGLGRLQGMKVAEIKHIMDKFVDNESQQVPGGESFATFRRRCLSFIRKMAAKAHTDGKVIALISHTRDLQLAKAWMAAGSPADLSIDRKTMDSYSDEIQTGGFLEIEPHELLGPQWKDTGKQDVIEDE